MSSHKWFKEMVYALRHGDTKHRLRWMKNKNEMANSGAWEISHIANKALTSH